MNTETILIKVASGSRPTATAGAIAGIIRESKRATICAIGAGAVNQAVKAIAIARSYLAEDGMELVCIPSFSETNIGGQERTTMRLQVLRR